jgi:diguanylate cyclase (GGDEF)-like protein
MTVPADPQGTAARSPLDRLVEKVVNRLHRRAATAPRPVTAGGSNRGRLALSASVILIALVAVLSGIFAGKPVIGAPPAELARLGIATAVAALAMIARVRVRMGATYVSLGWGEAAIIIALSLVPAGWIPLVMLVGVIIANGSWWAAGQITSALQVLYNAASLTVAGSAAAGLALLIATPYRAPFTIPVAAALIAAALLYSLIGIGLTAAMISVRSGARFHEVAGRTLGSKLFMIVGNVSVGLMVVMIVSVDLRWLLVLPPVLWLLRQSYGYRLRVDDERRGWRMFAVSTRALNRLDERGVAEAGIRGVTRLFAAETVEVRVLRPDGVLWCYRGGGSEPDSGPVPAGEGAAAGVTARQLLVGGAAIGELRLSFPRSVQLTPREQNQLSAFGDALAAALHDAASHHELQALSARSSHDAQHDPVTGIANRTALLAKGNGALRVLDSAAPVALLLLDIDHFREVNDTLGHSAGDELLRVTATRLGAQGRPGELIARLGGDEFAMLITAPPTPAEDESDALDHALGRARELADLLAAPTTVANVPIAVEVSIGVVTASAGNCDMTELLRRADIAMYQAKRGPGKVAWYDSMGDVGSTDRLALLAELREALAVPDQLVLALQPVVDLHTNAPTGVEALIRWQHPRRGELAPSEFIDVLENSELVGPFTRYVIDRALAAVAEWNSVGLDVPISVNLSPRSLLDRQLPGDIADLLRRHRVPAGQLILEITETVVVPESQTVTQVLEELRGLGLQLAVDDFGTGYSSLTFLTRIRVDEVKVDQTFVARMVESPEAMAIVRTIVDLARQLNLRVVAEGVETAEQRAALARLGCDSAQGFHFFHPMPAEKIVGVLLQLADSAGGRVIPLRAEGAS